MLWKQLDPRYRRLLRDGQRGDAVVVSAKTDATAGTPGMPGEGIPGTSAGVFGWNLTIRVKFEDGTTADHERYLDAVQHGESLRSLGMAPRVGMILPVRFDPKDRSRVEVDTAALRAESQEVVDERRAAEEAAVQQAEHDVRPLGQASQSEAASAAPGDANPGDPPSGGGEAVEEIKRAARAGNFAEVARLQGGLAGQAGGADQVIVLGGEMSAPGGSVDHVERLQKLADLHDRGVLTDAEFADQKAKILSEG